MRFAAVMLACGIASTAMPCLWDRDTLLIEARGMPDVMDVIAGRFDVNPPLFYQMRLERVESELTGGAEDLSLLDDGAVAAMHLHDFGKAHELLETKRVLLESEEEFKGDPSEDPNYRYHANLGTVYAHEWLEGGRQDADLHAKALEHLEEALEINPAAHFGREEVQVKVLKRAALGEEATVPVELSLSKDDREGLMGMIVIGLGQKSPVLMALLSETFGHRDAHMVAASLDRARDLGVEDGVLKATKNFYVEDAVEDKPRFRRDLKSAFDAGRAYQEARLDYMLPRLKRGEHPDTHPDFWSGWREPEKPRYQIGPDVGERIDGWWLRNNATVSVLSVVFGIPTVLFLGYRIVRRRYFE